MAIPLFALRESNIAKFNGDGRWFIAEIEAPALFFSFFFHVSFRELFGSAFEPVTSPEKSTPTLVAGWTVGFVYAGMKEFWGLHTIGCVRKLGSMVSEWVTTYTYKWDILGI